jgi:hypothetical protein
MRKWDELKSAFRDSDQVQLNLEYLSQRMTASEFVDFTLEIGVYYCRETGNWWENEL